MSLTKTQIDALIDRNCRSNSSKYSLADKTADENLAIDKVLSIIFKSHGRAQFDDSNHEDYPIIYMDIESGVRDYSFTTDEVGNLILEYYKVMAKLSADATFYTELLPVDQQSDPNTESIWNELNTTGKPARYDRTANGIFLDIVPDYNCTDGLKLLINREGSYFTTDDSDKRPGFAGIFHEYIALFASAQYCNRNKMFDLADRYERKMQIMEADIKKHYRDRSKDEQSVIQPEIINSI